MLHSLVDSARDSTSQAIVIYDRCGRLDSFPDPMAQQFPIIFMGVPVDTRLNVHLFMCFLFLTKAIAFPNV